MMMIETTHMTYENNCSVATPAFEDARRNIQRHNSHFAGAARFFFNKMRNR